MSFASRLNQDASRAEGVASTLTMLGGGIMRLTRMIGIAATAIGAMELSSKALAIPLFSYTPLDPGGATATIANGINNSGQIVGYFNNASSAHTPGFLFNGSSYATLPVVPDSDVHG